MSHRLVKKKWSELSRLPSESQKKNLTRGFCYIMMNGINKYLTKCSLDTVSCRSSYERRGKRGRWIEKRPRTIHCQALTLIKTIGCCVEFSRHHYWACFKRWFTYFMTSYKHFLYFKEKILNMFLRDFWKALFSRNVYKANHACIQKIYKCSLWGKTWIVMRYTSSIQS